MAQKDSKTKPPSKTLKTPKANSLVPFYLKFSALKYQWLIVQLNMSNTSNRSLTRLALHFSRGMPYQAFAHVVSCTPLSAILGEAKKLIPVLVDGLSMLSEDILNKDIIYSVLLVLCGIISDKNGSEAVVENAHIIIRRLIELLSYPHMMVIRETAIRCLVDMSEFPHVRIYPMRTQVLLSISKALDDPKRVVQQEAVRYQQAWASIASRSLHSIGY